MTDWRSLEPDANPGIRLGLLGYPVEHSLSPRMHAAALSALGIKGSYQAFSVASEDFSDCVKHLMACGFRGVNVTVPYKTLAARAGIPDHDDAVVFTQSANTLLFENGGVRVRNTDVPGFLSCIRTLKPSRAIVLGTGGAARSAIFALIHTGWSVSVWGRNFDAAVQCSALGNITPMQNLDATGANLIVNATPLGLKEGEMPAIYWDDVEHDAVFFDFAYRDGPTDLLREAMLRGLGVIDGRELLAEQGAFSLEWWIGQRAPKQVMRAAIGL